MAKVARVVRWMIATFALIGGVVVVGVLAIVISFRPLQRRAMQKEREVIIAAAADIIRGTGPAVDVLPLRTRLWARAANWHAQHCSYTNFKYDTGGITAHCAKEDLRFNFRSACDDFWAGRLLRLTSCSATPFAMAIRRIVPGQQEVELLSDGEPVAE